MKRIVFALMVVILAACGKDEETSPKEVNPLVGTSWTAPDEIAEFIYGGNCSQIIEFFADSKCQKIEIIEGTRNFDKTEVFEGTYELYSNNDSVRWTANDRTEKGRISGSVIIMTMKTSTGGNVTYVKN